MKDLFPEYYSPEDSDFERAFAHCEFVLDTNVLLNLYRYPEVAREDVFALFEKVRDRIWIPYHVALEFQRNRLSVISEQKRRFSDVRSIVDTTNATLQNEFAKLRLKEAHSAIDPDPLLAGLRKIFDRFIHELDELESRQKDVFDDDPVRKRIDTLLGGRIGEKPSEDFILSVMKDSEKRFPSRMSPGFADADKEKSKSASYWHGGIEYSAKIGDLLIWRQILEYVATLDGRPVIFVTDDQKEDWWWKENSLGDKTIGPHPLLVEEMRRVAGASFFYVYRPLRLLEAFKKFTDFPVKDETIEQVRDVSKSSDIDKFTRLEFESVKEFLPWLKKSFPVLSDIEIVGTDQIVAGDPLGFFTLNIYVVSELRSFMDAGKFVDNISSMKTADNEFAYIAFRANSFRQAHSIRSEVSRSTLRPRLAIGVFVKTEAGLTPVYEFLPSDWPEFTF